MVLATMPIPAGWSRSEPVVTYQPYGIGRVVVIEGAGMWRWAFLPPHQQQHDEVYRSLWHSLLRWLVGQCRPAARPEMALRSDKISFEPAEPATATLLVREEAGSGQVRRIELSGDGIEGRRKLTPMAPGRGARRFPCGFR